MAAAASERTVPPGDPSGALGDEPGARPSSVEALAAAASGRGCWTWALWGELLLDTPAGRWALDVLSRFFGPDYVQRQSEARPAGLFDQSICPMLGPLRVDRVVELAARVASLGDQPRFAALREEASRDTQPAYLAHLQAMLAVAAPLATDGWTLDLHPRNPTADGQRPTGGKAPDLRAERDGVAFAVEVKRLGEDQELRNVDRFTDRLTVVHRGLEGELGHALTVECAAVCDADELDTWADQVRRASARGVRAIHGPGGGRTELDFDAVSAR